MRKKYKHDKYSHNNFYIFNGNWDLNILSGKYENLYSELVCFDTRRLETSNIFYNDENSKPCHKIHVNFKDSLTSNYINHLNNVKKIENL